MRGGIGETTPSSHPLREDARAAPREALRFHLSNLQPRKQLSNLQLTGASATLKRASNAASKMGGWRLVVYGKNGKKDILGPEKDTVVPVTLKVVPTPRGELGERSNYQLWQL